MNYARQLVTPIFTFFALHVAFQAQGLELSEQQIYEILQKGTRAIELGALETRVVEYETKRLETLWGARLNLNSSYQINAEDQTNAVFGTRNDTLESGARFQKSYSSGTNIEAGFNTTRLTSNSPFIALDPAIQSRWTLRATQSLWRDQFGKQIRSQLESLKKKYRATEHAQTRRLELLLGNALIQYWEWLGLDRELEIFKQAKERADHLHRLIVDKTKLGIAEKVDRLASQVNVVTQNSLVEAAKLRRNQKCRDLKYLIELEADQSSCQSREKFYQNSDLMLDQKNWQLALKYRTDFIEKKLELESQEHSVLAFRSGANPSLDLFTEISTNSVTDNWINSIEESSSFQNPKWLVGLELEIPLGESSEKVDLKISRVRRQQKTLELTELSRAISKEVKQAEEAITSLRTQLEEQNLALNLEKNKLAAKERDFRIGRSDATEFVRFQQDVLNAELNRLDIEGSLQIAQIQLLLAQGTLLSSYQSRK